MVPMRNDRVKMNVPIAGLLLTAVDAGGMQRERTKEKPLTVSGFSLL